MKSYVLNLFFGLLFISAAAQNATEKAISQSKNFLNDKLTFLVLQNFVKDNEKYSDSLNTISSNFQNLTVETAFPYQKLTELLKSAGFNKINIKLSGPIDKLNTQPLIGQSYDKAALILIDSGFAILKKNYSNFHQPAEENKDELVNAITVYLSQPPKIKDTDSNPPPLTSGNFPEEVKETGYFSMWMILPFILIIAIGIAGYIAWLKLNSRLRSLETPKNSSSSSTDVSDADFYNAVANSSQRNEFDRYFGNNSTIKDFQDAIQKLQKQVSMLEDEKMKTGGEIVATKQSPLANELKTDESFYMSLPITNYFLDKTKSLSKDNTVYKFIVKAGNKREARFSIHVTGAQLADIVNASESFIKPACDEENVPGTNVKNIRTVQPGLAILEGDKWMIKNKALIHYD